MNRIDRLTAIILLLQGGKRTASDIAKRFEVSKRTIFRDIEALCEMGVPIVTESGMHGGYTLMPDYSLTPLQLTSREALLLRLALSSVSQLADTPFKQERESLLAKMQALIPAKQLQDAEHLLRTVRLDIPARSYTMPFIEQLIESARQEQWLRVSYRSERGASEQTILPRRLYAAAGFWYCEAYSLERREERTYRVDRFVEVSAAPTPEHVESSRSELPYGHPSHAEVRIQLTARGVLVMERDPQLGEAIQPLGEEGGLLCFRCPESEYDWLVRTLLSLGPDAEVLAPNHLRERVRQATLDIAQRYAKNSDIGLSAFLPYTSAMTIMRKDKPMERSQRLQKAQDFMWRNARLLERFLFSALFDGGSKEPVLAALRAYQNVDGGFGNALEPDKRCPDSQPQDIEFALHILDILDAKHDPMVARACDYLVTITTPEGGIPYALPSLNAYPHAEWWTTGDNPPASLNPTAAIVGLLLKHGIQHPWIESATQFCWREIATTDTTEFHTLMPVITFLEYAPDRTRAEQELQRIAKRISQPGVIELDPNAQGYVHKPLDWAPTPQSYCRRLFDEETIAKHLAALANHQQPDGGWPIKWDAISPAVELEWRGRVTIGALRTLEAYREENAG